MNKMSLASRGTERSGKGRAIVIHFCAYSGKEMTFRLRNQGRQPGGGSILKVAFAGCVGFNTRRLGEEPE